jgi:hypothetical protein
MKKLILILVVVLSSFVSKAQDIIDVYAVETGTWIEEEKEWSFHNYTACEISFFGKDKKIVGNDLENSTYYLHDLLIDKRNLVSWNAVDKNNKDCVISLGTKRKNRYFIVMYSNICYRYYW